MRSDEFVGNFCFQIPILEATNLISIESPLWVVFCFSLKDHERLFRSEALIHELSYMVIHMFKVGSVKQSRISRRNRFLKLTGLETAGSIHSPRRVFQRSKMLLTN